MLFGSQVHFRGHRCSLMSSSRRPQRRRAGRDTHTDPSSADAEALLNPSRLEEQLSKKLAGKSSPLPADDESSEEDSPRRPPGHAVAKNRQQHHDAASLTSVLNEADDEDSQKHISEAEAVFTDGGDASVQKMLQDEIAKTKRLESEVAQLKKKVDAAKRQQDAKALELSKLTQHKELMHQACRALIAERERLEQLNTEVSERDLQRRDEVRSKFDRDVEGIIAKVDDQARQKLETVAENTKLSAEFDELKASFDRMMSDKMSQWKERDAETSAVVADLQATIAENDRLQQLAQSREAEAGNLLRGTTTYLEQAAMYRDRMGEFEAALEKSAEVVELTSKREADYRNEITALEDGKTKDVATRKEVEQETMKIRGRIREMRKQITQLEKSKAQAEKRCRNAQDAARKRGPQGPQTA